MNVQYSMVVDQHPKFAYQAWNLARSLVHYSAAAPEDVHVQFTSAVPDDIRTIFAGAGYSIHQIEKFGDGKWCNKLAQLPNLSEREADFFVLLDTDMIATADIRPFLRPGYFHAKPVDCQNPPLGILHEIFLKAAVQVPALVPTDTGDGQTFVSNANGGFYAIPGESAGEFSNEWRRWALWLLAHPEPLARVNKLMHVDQISAALAVSSVGIPLAIAPSNVNYFTHMAAPHRYLVSSEPIALLHYHDVSLNVLGLLQPFVKIEPSVAQAVEAANRIFRENFHNTLFWQFRYASFPGRGSGLGSRGGNADYKKQLLCQQGLEEAESVLDIGCGDFTVLEDCQFKRYLGLDVSHEALRIARQKRPDLRFEIYARCEPEPHHMVVCMEVLIHQTTYEDYVGLIRTLSQLTGKTLIVSGYEHKDVHHMCYFHEPLSKSLRETGDFTDIRLIGAHSDVVVYRCEKE